MSPDEAGAGMQAGCFSQLYAALAPNGPDSFVRL